MSYIYEYPRAALTADAVIIAKKANEKKVLLIQRGAEPYKGMWALPGGFVDIDEDVDDAVVREVEEETGLKLEGYEQLKVFGKPGRDPRHRTVTIAYYNLIDNFLAVKGMDDASAAKWFSLDNLPALAFDHIDIIKCAQLKLNL
ncbi:MAG: NUDIX hydrolase [Marinilabiliaceae bacterium]|nr:NUDIX hydrolase [Marinilabiliaceae bacterium]